MTKSECINRVITGGSKVVCRHSEGRSREPTTWGIGRGRSWVLEWTRSWAVEVEVVCSWIEAMGSGVRIRKLGVWINIWIIIVLGDGLWNIRKKKGSPLLK